MERSVSRLQRPPARSTPEKEPDGEGFVRTTPPVDNMHACGMETFTWVTSGDDEPKRKRVYVQSDKMSCARGFANCFSESSPGILQLSCCQGKLKEPEVKYSVFESFEINAA